MANKKNAAKKSEVSESQTREKKKFYVVQVALLNDEKKKEIHTTYPETTTNEKALKSAIAEYTNVIGVQINGVFSSASDLIKSMQPKVENGK